MSDETLAVLRGVLFRCTIRGGHASLAIVATGGAADGAAEDEDGRREATGPRPKEDEERMVLVIVRLGGPDWRERADDDDRRAAPRGAGDGGGGRPRGGDDDKAHASLMRSNVRRMCKLGNEMEFRGRYDDAAAPSSASGGSPEALRRRSSTDWRAWERFVVDYYLRPTSESHLGDNLRVCRELKWNSKQCQTARAKYFTSRPKKQQPKKRIKLLKKNGDRNNIAATTKSDAGPRIGPFNKEEPTMRDERMQSKLRHHGGGIGKRKQGQIVADFLLWVLSHKYTRDGDGGRSIQQETQSTQNDQLAPNGNTEEVQPENQHLFMKRWVQFPSSLAASDRSKDNKGLSVGADTNNERIERKRPYPISEGIIDAAGGAGHVSLGLALRGVHSTVVDPRNTVGKLPGRDRKALKKSKQKPFSTYRAWFGSRPKGVDSFYREGSGVGAVSNNASRGQDHAPTFSSVDGSSHSGDPNALPICCMCSEDNLLSGCNAIVALHPDEATGAIVETAVEHEIPFVAVPCCVFSRLFPKRIKPVAVAENESASGAAASEGNAGITVSTYYDLIDWLVAKHPSIKVTRLPFEGANIAVWAAFN